jgi:hypothetical protein
MLGAVDGAAPGYGMQQIPTSRGTAVGHGGRAFGAATMLVFLRESDASVCILSNYDRPADKRVFEAFEDIVGVGINPSMS